MAYPFDDQTIGCYQSLPALICPGAQSCICGGHSQNSYMGSQTDAAGHKICFFCVILYCLPCKNICIGGGNVVIG